MTSPRLRTPRLLAIAGATAAALALAGCSATNPITTQDEYAASDGVRVTVGEIRGDNLMVLSDGDGAPGVLHGGLVNDGSEDERVTFTFEGSEPTTVDVPAGATVLLDGTDGDDRADVRLAAVETIPGGLVSLTLGTDTWGASTFDVPVLDGTLPEYAGLVPTPTPTATPTPTPTATETASAEPTPSPTATAEG
ncbi:hypothetical protein GXP71_19395 [Cellulomonas sp. H30R-01]|uniref:hypothetical protein n=1 Tax=Cellulomonas sp. H30R-01 TaxID=2704467 RepID=UPI00138C234F|nr:hypothetical protein [Cellulomonas sp. H30R-01]QHT58034.1 hypothetical protein GXP71_19395 [Cellulomonas sp. H30R-01]